MGCTYILDPPYPGVGIYPLVTSIGRVEFTPSEDGVGVKCTPHLECTSSIFLLIKI